MTNINVVPLRARVDGGNPAPRNPKSDYQSVLQDLNEVLNSMSPEDQIQARMSLAANLVDDVAREAAESKPTMEVVQLMLISTCIESERLRLNEEI